MPPKFAPLSRMTTREKNKTAHPGAIDLPSPRRTRTEMQEARQEAADEEAKKEAELEERRKRVAKLAGIEDRLRKEDEAAEIRRNTGRKHIYLLYAA